MPFQDPYENVRHEASHDLATGTQNIAVPGDTMNDELRTIEAELRALGEDPLEGDELEFLFEQSPEHLIAPPSISRRSEHMTVGTTKPYFEGGASPQSEESAWRRLRSWFWRAVPTASHYRPLRSGVALGGAVAGLALLLSASSSAGLQTRAWLSALQPTTSYEAPVEQGISPVQNLAFARILRSQFAASCRGDDTCIDRRYWAQKYSTKARVRRTSERAERGAQ